MMRYFVSFLLLLSMMATAQAKRFTNQYCEFELPGGWECELEGSEWVCQSANKDRRKEAIIILAAKKRGQQDDLPQYQAYLKGAKTYALPGGQKQVSEAKYVKTKTINSHMWVDALHLASEVPGFYTRYLATVKEDLGVAVTFSVSKQHYQEYQPIFDRIIDSLRVFRQRQIKVADYKIKKTNDEFDPEEYIPDSQKKGDFGNKKGGKGGGGAGEDIMLYGGILAALAAFVVMKKKGGKGKKKARKKKKK